MIVAIIPARGGSKRIPRKNVREFCCVPILVYSSVVAQKAGIFDAIIVSTDDDEIAILVENCGAEVPYRRPAGLAHDHTTTFGVIAHGINWL